MPSDVRQKQIVRVSVTGIIANVVLAAFKAVVGLLSGSIAIVLDAVNNLSDALSSVITVIGARLALRPADKEHPLGHGRYEYLSSAVISVIVLYAGVTALGESVKSIIHHEDPDYSAASLVIVAAAVAVKIALGLFTKTEGAKLHSDALVNSGQDALLDAVISTSTLLAAMLFLVLHISVEAWLGAVISLIIIKSGVDMVRETISKLLGERVEGEVAKAVKQTICETKGVMGAYDLVLNNYGPDKWLGSVHIEVPDTWTADKIDTVSREIAARVGQKNHVIMTAIGIYSHNSSSDEIKAIRTAVTQAVMSEEYILQIHGFYCDIEQKTLRFDIVVDYLAPDAKEVHRRVLQTVEALYPDYTVCIQQDADFSD